MFIQTESTPNPATLKFLPGRAVMPGGGAANFTSSSTAQRSPLAQRLFGIDAVKGVFLGDDFITVTKSEEIDWYTLKPVVLGAIMEHFTTGQAVIEEDPSPSAASDEDESEIVTQIRELIDTRVRPAVAQDGGDIVFHRFHEGVVFLEMHGSCSGCPSSTATLKAGIENMLRHYVPEVTAVQAV